MKLIIGLGNPGKEYERTRHNAGFVVIDKLTTDYGLRTTADKRSDAEVAKGKINGKRALLAKPQTFMNNSGMAARALLNFYKLTPANIIVIHDDKDIPLGEFRIQKNRGAAGHNGVQSIIDQLGTKNFTRVRVGVAPQDKTIRDTAEFVLGKFTKEEQKLLSKVVVKIMEEIKQLVA